MRTAERQAKEKKARIWKDYKPPTTGGNAKQYTGTVVEVVMGDALVVKRGEGDYQKIFLASIRPPRLEDGGQVI